VLPSGTSLALYNLYVNVAVLREHAYVGSALLAQPAPHSRADVMPDAPGPRRPPTADGLALA